MVCLTIITNDNSVQTLPHNPVRQARMTAFELKAVFFRSKPRRERIQEYRPPHHEGVAANVMVGKWRQFSIDSALLRPYGLEEIFHLLATRRFQCTRF